LRLRWLALWREIG